MAERWRTGRSVGRTLYIHQGDDPEGHLIGMVDTPELAALICTAVNAKHAADDLAEQEAGQALPTWED